MTKKTNFLLGLAVASGLFLASGAAQAATILTFDGVGDCNVASEVTITGGVGNEACQVSTGPSGSSLVRSTFPNVLDSYWVAEFDFDVSNVSIDLGDFGSDQDRLFLWAWDSLNNLLGFTQLDIASNDNTMHTLSLMFTNIRSISFGTIGQLFPNDPDGLGLGGIYADNLTYTRTPAAVPVPAALPLLLLGLGGLGVLGLGRKRKTAKA